MGMEGNAVRRGWRATLFDGDGGRGDSTEMEGNAVRMQMEPLTVVWYDDVGREPDRPAKRRDQEVLGPLGEHDAHPPAQNTTGPANQGVMGMRGGGGGGGRPLAPDETVISAAPPRPPSGVSAGIKRGVSSKSPLYLHQVCQSG